MFCCGICEQIFNLDSDLKNHMLEHEEQTQVNYLSIICILCEFYVIKSFFLKTNLKLFFYRMHQLVILT